MSKRPRDFPAHLQAPLKTPHVHVENAVNPFQVMMAAARAQQQQSQQHQILQQQQQQLMQQQGEPGTSTVPPAPLAPATAPCTSCGRQQQLAALHQCESCQDVFCSMCSLSNYDERDVRIFCFDCNTQRAAGATVGCTAGSGAGSSLWMHSTADMAGQLSACQGTLSRSTPAPAGPAPCPSPYSTGHQQRLGVQLFSSPFPTAALHSPALASRSPFGAMPMSHPADILGM